MQYNIKDFNPALHDKFKALTVKQPYANDLVTDRGDGIAWKYIEVRSKPTKYRGQLLICSSKKPSTYGDHERMNKILSLENGCTVGFVELYDVKPVSEFTAEDWEATRIPVELRKEIKKGYGWIMRNPERVIEYPIVGQLGIWNLVYTKGEIVKYPSIVEMDLFDIRGVLYGRN